jgi:hypothetical protein
VQTRVYKGYGVRDYCVHRCTGDHDSTQFDGGIFKGYRSDLDWQAFIGHYYTWHCIGGDVCGLDIIILYNLDPTLTPTYEVPEVSFADC